MFGTRWRLFRLLGIPISLDASWLIILVLLTVTMANVFPGLMHEYYPGVILAPSAYWVMGLLTALAFFVCLLLHELGHALVARSLHMPIRGITLFLFGGVAEITEEPRSAHGEFLMAIAGPAVSVLLAAICALLTWAGYAWNWPPPVVLMLGYLAVINAVVLVFNLVPAFPLDGGRVLRAIIWGITGNLRRATHGASLAGRAFAWLLVAWGVFQLLNGNWFGGAWSILIGMFLHNAARSSYQQVLIREALQGEPVRRFMTPDPITVSPSLDLRDWVDNYVYRYHLKGFPVVSEGRLEGFIDTGALAAIPRAEWEHHTVGEVMRRDLDEISIRPEAEAYDALGRMQRIGSGRLLVVEGGRLVGIVSLKDLLRFLSLKLELEGDGEGRPLPPPGASWDARRSDPALHSSRGAADF